MRLFRVRGASLVLAIALAGVLPGCATTAAPRVDHDPLEGANRAFFAFNEVLDRWLMEPLAIGWDFIIPVPVQNGISRFFLNLGFPRRLLANLCQAEIANSGEELGRFVVNTTVGIAGFFDPAAEWWGLEAHHEDFGQVFGRWGIGPGPFLVWPLIGPSNPRDSIGIVFDSLLTVSYVSIDIISAVNGRARVLDEARQGRASSTDYYRTVREAVISQRWHLVRNLPPGEVLPLRSKPLPDPIPPDEVRHDPRSHEP